MITGNCHQNLTFWCHNAIAAFDANLKTYRRSLKLLASNDIELTINGYSQFRYKVIHDGCQVIIN